MTDHAHAFQPHPDGKTGCQLCPFSPLHSIHAGDAAGAQRPEEDETRLFYPPINVGPRHVGRRGSDRGDPFPQRLRGRRDEAA